MSRLWHDPRDDKLSSAQNWRGHWVQPVFVTTLNRNDLLCVAGEISFVFAASGIEHIHAPFGNYRLADASIRYVGYYLTA